MRFFVLTLMAKSNRLLLNTRVTSFSPMILSQSPKLLNGFVENGVFFFCIRSWSQSLMTLKCLLLPVDAKQQLSGRRDSFILGFFFSLIVKLWPQFIPNGIYSELNNSHSLSDPYLAFLRFFLDFNVLTRFQRIIRKRVHVENWQPCVTYYTLTLDIAYRVELKE